MGKKNSITLDRSMLLKFVPKIQKTISYKANKKIKISIIVFSLFRREEKRRRKKMKIWKRKRK